MKGKSWEMPPGMFFGKYYCAKCGEKLEKEMTHRVVTEADKDYHAFQNYGRYPQYDYDVYGYRFACPNCGNRVAYREQRILARIQKEQETRVLAASEIRENYARSKAAESKRALGLELLYSVFLVLVVVLGGYTTFTDGKFQSYIVPAAILLIVAVVMALWIIAKHKGKLTEKAFFRYSYEKKALLEKLHTYCTNNRDLVARANRCYCVYCKADMDRREIVDFLELENTAVCPKCGVDAVLPDSIDETISRSLLQELHEYWF